MGFSTSFSYRFEAAHRFIDSSSIRCATPHGHSWNAEIEFKASEFQLDNSMMLHEFTSLKSAWKTFIHETVDHSFFIHHRDPILQSLVKEYPPNRLLIFPGNPTTELVAALFLRKCVVMHDSLQAKSTVAPSKIIIRETETNSISLSNFEYESFMRLNQIDKFAGWWNSVDPTNRCFEGF